jgi:2-hydroxychromene-2-carboxylate isomerase
MPVTIDYYLSLNSPWTYMGSALFADIAKRNGATVRRQADCHCQSARRSGALTG